MSGQIIDFASRRDPEAWILVAMVDEGYEVRLDPPGDRPGVRDGSFPTFTEARRYAVAMRILTKRPIDFVVATDLPQGAA